MLGMKNYSADYVKACRATIDANVRAYDALRFDTADGDFEARYFNTQALALEYMFVHRLSGAEGKDGNPLNEVRVICNSIVLNGGALQVERLPGWPNSSVSGLTLPSSRSVLKLEPGTPVKLSRQDFVKLANAFFIELEKRYS